MKAIITTLLMLCVAVCNAQQLPLSAKSAIVVDVDTHATLYEKNSDHVVPIASVTKLMTALVTLDAGLPLDEELTITKEDDIATHLNGRPMGNSLPVGATLTRGDILRLALMNSQNRAAAALARTYPGGTEAFVEAMNEKAQSLGMVHTEYVEPSGLLAGNKSSASDLAILLQVAAENEIIRTYSTTKSYVITHRDRLITYGTTDILVRNNSWDVIVQKTGFTGAAGQCLVIMATIAERRIAIVLLNAAGRAERARDANIIKYWIQTGNIPGKTLSNSMSPYGTPKRSVHKHKRR